MDDGTQTYAVSCYACRASFDALATSWCSCLAAERSLVCPHCLTCFCKAPASFKSEVWRQAPKALWEKKLQERAEPSAQAVNPDPGDAPRPLVLLVEDDPVISRIATRVVKGLGYGLVLGHNGAEGLELAKRYKPDLVLTDALMPKLDGREMGRLIKQSPETGSTIVVVMTSLYTSVKYRTEAFKQYKVDDYLAKPVDFMELKALLEKHLG